MMMAAMNDFGANLDGSISDDQVNYLSQRSQVAGMIVTGYAYVSEVGKQSPTQISATENADMGGLRRLARAGKQHGAKVIMQLSHAGHSAVAAQMDGMTPVAASELHVPWLTYDLHELTETEVEEVIADFGQATRRAIEAGFDGIELHACNHDLIQQFFSPSTNFRTDYWGGDFEKRSRFPLAVLDEVIRVVKELDRPDFIIGYRISPEEVHGSEVSFTYQDTLKLIAAIADRDVDYLNISLAGTPYHYDSVPRGFTHGTHATVAAAKIDHKIPIFTGNFVTNADEALDAVKYSDGVYLGRAALMEPEFAKKIADGNANDIVETMSLDRMRVVDFPKGLIATYQDPSGMGGHEVFPGFTANEKPGYFYEYLASRPDGNAENSQKYLKLVQGLSESIK